MRLHKAHHPLIIQRIEMLADNLLYGDDHVVYGSLSQIMDLFPAHFMEDDLFLGKVYREYI
jgi:hypothetical protein